MASRKLPGLGLTGDFVDGEDGWGESMNANLLMMSVIAAGFVLATVDALPDAPAEGDIYILSTDATIQVYDSAAWTAYTPSEGWMVYDQGADLFIRYDGAAWVEVTTGSDGGGGGGDYALPDPTDKGGLIVAAKGDGTGYELVKDQVGGGGSTDLVSAIGWRIRVIDFGSGGYWGASEIKFYDINGGEIPATGGASHARDFYDSTRTPDKAFDGNLLQSDQNGYLGKNKTADATIGYIFPAAVVVATIGYFPLQDTNERPNNVYIEYQKVDGGAWTTLGASQSISALPVVYGQATILTAQKIEDRGIPPLAGQAGKILAVKAGEANLEWVDKPQGGGGGGGGGGGESNSFRFMRIASITNYGDGASASEIRFKYQGADLPKPTIVSDTGGNGSYPFSKAIDGVVDNGFFSTYDGGANRVVVLDFGDVVTIDEFVWRNRIEGSATQAPSKVELQLGYDVNVYGRQLQIYYDQAGWATGNTARSRTLA